MKTFFKVKGDLKMAELLCHAFQKTRCLKIGSSSGNIIHFLMELLKRKWYSFREKSLLYCFSPFPPLCLFYILIAYTYLCV